MKGFVVIAMMVLVNIWMAPVSMAMGKAEQPDADKTPQKKESTDVPKTGTGKAASDPVRDDDVAERLEMLQFMEMLEHFELIKDLDVLEGGGK